MSKEREEGYSKIGLGAVVEVQRRRHPDCDPVPSEPIPVELTTRHAMTTIQPATDDKDQTVEKMIPIYDATAPIACTITGDEIPQRIEQMERMRAAMTKLERTSHGLLLHFPDRPDIEAELHTFAVDEKRCCQFWGFAIDRMEGDLTLRWDGPPDTAGSLDRLLAFLDGDQPLTADSALLTTISTIDCDSPRSTATAIGAVWPEAIAQTRAGSSSPVAGTTSPAKACDRGPMTDPGVQPSFAM